MRSSISIVLGAIVLAFVLGTPFGSLILPKLSFQIGSQQTTTATSSCSGQIFDFNCITNWNATFPVSINYSGSWNAKYLGYYTNIENASGNFNGTGLYSKTITLNAYGLAQPTLCVTATKQDSSNLTIVLSVGQISTNRTSLANGTIKVCSTVVL